MKFIVKNSQSTANYSSTIEKPVPVRCKSTRNLKLAYLLDHSNTLQSLEVLKWDSGSEATFN